MKFVVQVLLGLSLVEEKKERKELADAEPMFEREAFKLLQQINREKR